MISEPKELKDLVRYRKWIEGYLIQQPNPRKSWNIIISIEVQINLLLALTMITKKYLKYLKGQLEGIFL